MIGVTITESMRQRARARLEREKIDPRRGLHQFGSELDRILWGYIGEEALNAILQGRVVDGYEHDIERWGKTYEAKTILCKGRPDRTFLATVNSADLRGRRKQAADFYVFVRLREDLQRAWIVGYMPPDEFMSRGRFVRKGEAAYAGLVMAKANATVLPIHALRPAEGLRLSTARLFD